MTGTAARLWLDSLRRACGYCLLPRVFLWSLVPMLLTSLLALLLGWWFWEPALDAVQGALERWALGAGVLDWLDAVGAGALRSVIAPLVVVALTVPLLAIASLLAVALFMTRRVTRLVAQRRFPALARCEPPAPWPSITRVLLSTLLALTVLLASLPLWLIPPLALLVPPLVWGWLAWRVIGFEALAEHASPVQRRRLLRVHRWPLLAIGLLCGLLAGAASTLWLLSAAALIYAPWLVVLVMGWYTVVFGFACLWFAHYLMAVLAAAPVAAGADSRFGLAIC
ncbi:EI24 domain-containing protein [Rivibacter subsaxonicus]|uniref:Etoposide-induced protein 2.4 (EI24) n=1 Tax=Rivibacter subsaxonicus TaxID=457575 RepID=A0A4V2FUT2_9BURK|nr:EI24 domain-containing protein [Rivibacter subsaxonicus]RZU03116.1 etoposide-induced protein 2.4 (EI24) [Rivibacter subsaxonicus]